jgi:acetyl esterase/lipase
MSENASTEHEQDPPAPPPFHAPGERELQHPANATIHTGLMYSALNGYRGLELDLFVPQNVSGLAPCVVWIHGGGWLFGNRMQPPSYWAPGALFQAAIDAGIAVATIDYRHAREASFPAQLHDGFAALRWLREFGPQLGIDPERFAVWGESAGGHLASLLALVTDPELHGTDGVAGDPVPIRAAVSYYGVSNVDAMPSFLESAPKEWVDELIRAAGGKSAEPLDVLLEDSPYPRAEANRLASPVHHVRADAPPFLLIHGDADTVVPIAQGEMFHDALVAVGAEVEFVRVPGADHVFVGTDPTPQFARAVEFLKAHL